MSLQNEIYHDAKFAINSVTVITSPCFEFNAGQRLTVGKQDLYSQSVVKICICVLWSSFLQYTWSINLIIYMYVASSKFSFVIHAICQDNKLCVCVLIARQGLTWSIFHRRYFKINFNSNLLFDEDFKRLMFRSPRSNLSALMALWFIQWFGAE